MAHGGKMECSYCGTNISMSGSVICPKCDPDIMAILEDEVERKSPEMCGRCYKEKHLPSHEG